MITMLLHAIILCANTYKEFTSNIELLFYRLFSVIQWYAAAN